MDDLISRQGAKDRLTILVNEIEGIFADIRERNVDDSVCGLCEYDCDHGIDGSAFECLGFERDDCFKLKDEYREEWTDVKALPSAQVDLSGYSDRLWKSAYDRGYERCKQDAIEAVDVKCLHRGIVKGIQEIIEDLPSAQPEQPERKKGEWIKISPANIYECSECGKNVMTDDISAYDFCHGCGADMRGEYGKTE